MDFSAAPYQTHHLFIWNSPELHRLSLILVLLPAYRLALVIIFTAMTRTRNTIALMLAFLMSAGVVSAQAVDSAAAAATTVNTANTSLTSVRADIGNTAFVPHNIVIVPGTTVTWTNRSTVEHMLIADDGSFTSGQIPVGGTFSHLFSGTGTFLYYDSANGSPGGEGMFGIVVVLPAGTAATSVIPGIPNTGAGGNALGTILLLVLSGLGAAAGMLFLRRKSA
jgi:plastocyanin